MSRYSSTHPPCEFEIFYARLCHTPLGQLTSAQRAILQSCGKRIKGPVTDVGVYVVKGERTIAGTPLPTDTDEQTILAASPLHAVKVAIKRDRELGITLGLERLQVWELTGKGRIEADTTMIRLALMESSDHG